MANEINESSEMDLRVRSKLHSKLNDKEWIVNQKKRKPEPESSNRKKTRRETRRSVNEVAVRQKDEFCWFCHKPECDTVCQTCVRSFHKRCLPIPLASTELVSCHECLLSSQISVTPVTCCDIKELLNLAIDIVFNIEELPDCFLDFKKEESVKKLICVMDKKTIIQKINGNSYKNPLELLSDLKWIVHNIYISSKDEYISFAEKIQKKFEEELLLLDACTECYYFKNVHKDDISDEKHFSQKCTQPHKVVFAKIRGHPFWPAKCLKILKNKAAVVVFFGTYELLTVPVQNYLTLDSPPSPLQNQKQWYLKALIEMDEYYRSNTSTVNDIKENESRTTGSQNVFCPPLKKSRSNKRTVKTQTKHIKTETKDTQTAETQSQSVESQTSSCENHGTKVSTAHGSNSEHFCATSQCADDRQRRILKELEALVIEAQSKQQSPTSKATPDSSTGIKENECENDADENASSNEKKYTLLDFANLWLSLPGSSNVQGIDINSLNSAISNSQTPSSCIPADENVVSQSQASVNENLNKVQTCQASTSSQTATSTTSQTAPSTSSALSTSSSQTQPCENRDSDDEVVVMQEIIKVPDSSYPSTSRQTSRSENSRSLEEKMRYTRDFFLIPVMERMMKLIDGHDARGPSIKKEPGVSAETPSSGTDMFGPDVRSLFTETSCQNIAANIKRELLEEE